MTRVEQILTGDHVRRSAEAEPEPEQTGQEALLLSARRILHEHLAAHEDTLYIRNADSLLASSSSDTFLKLFDVLKKLVATGNTQIAESGITLVASTKLLFGPEQILNPAVVEFKAVSVLTSHPEFSHAVMKVRIGSTAEIILEVVRSEVEESELPACLIIEHQPEKTARCHFQRGSISQQVPECVWDELQVAELIQLIPATESSNPSFCALTPAGAAQLDALYAAHVPDAAPAEAQLWMSPRVELEFTTIDTMIKEISKKFAADLGAFLLFQNFIQSALEEQRAGAAQLLKIELRAADQSDRSEQLEYIHVLVMLLGLSAGGFLILNTFTREWDAWIKAELACEAISVAAVAYLYYMLAAVRKNR